MAGYDNSVATASADATAAPSAVLNLRQCGATANSITMCWDAATGSDAYDIYRAPTTATGAVGEFVATALASNLTETTYTNKGLDPGDSYWYRVVSKKGSDLVTVGAEALGSTLDAGSPRRASRAGGRSCGRLQLPLGDGAGRPTDVERAC